MAKNRFTSAQLNSVYSHTSKFSKLKSDTRKICLLLLMTGFLSFFFNAISIPTQAAYISGFQELWFNLKADDPSTQKWDLYSLYNYVELRTWSNPYKNTDFYAKFTSLNYLDEAHFKIRLGSNARGLETYFFLKQRRCWIDAPLLGITSDDIISENNTNSGIRTDFWGIKGLNGFVVYAHPLWSDNQYNIIRLRKALGEKTFLGLSYAKKKWAAPLDAYNSITGFDLKTTYKKIYIEMEYAQSKNPSEDLPRKHNSAFGFRVDNLILNLRRYGKLGFRMLFYNRGENYRNYLGNNEYNSRSYQISGYYLFPELDITYSFSNQLQKDVTATQFKSFETYNELYIGLINGFALKFYYKNYLDLLANIAYPSVFAQMEINKKNLWLKMQYKIKDIGTAYERYLYGVEASVTLIPRLKGFFREAMVTNYNWARSVFFGQLRYDFGWGVESYLEYGNGGYASNDLVNDDGFANYSQETENIIKVGLKANW